jgi:hypothetical protein
MDYWDSNNRGLERGRIATLNNERYAVFQSASFKKHSVCPTARPFLTIPDRNFPSYLFHKRKVQSYPHRPPAIYGLTYSYWFAKIELNEDDTLFPSEWRTT